VLASGRDPGIVDDKRGRRTPPAFAGVRQADALFPPAPPKRGAGQGGKAPNNNTDKQNFSNGFHAEDSIGKQLHDREFKGR
jgi:hypothetical protein